MSADRSDAPTTEETAGSLLNQEVGKVTLRDFLDVLGRESKERVELAGILRDINTAINELELNMHGKGDQMMTRLKRLRDAFNRIPPRWFHA